MKPAPPLRFLALAVGGWILARALILAPLWPGPGPRPPPPFSADALTPSQTIPAPIQALSPIALPSPDRLTSLIRDVSYKTAPMVPAPRGRSEPRAFLLATAPTQAQAPAIERSASGDASPAIRTLPAGPPLWLPAPAPGPGRWSGSAWVLARGEGGGAALAPGGTLGGSQAGARLLFRIDGGLALSGRLYAPLRRIEGAEAAFGLDWRPARRLPVRLLVERRQALGREGRSAFALTAYGGGELALPRGFRLEGYGQAGLVGARSRDPFVDGAARLSLDAGPARIGGGAWGAAQPGAARLDIGPQASVRLPLGGATLRLEADWRFRIAGGAEPGSGPALILAADY